MATGGYKCVKFSWQGGRTDSALDRVKFILNGVCDAIIGANVGWQLDTLTPTSSDFLTMPSTSSSYPNLVKVLKLEYDSHTYRMGIGYNYNKLSSSYKLKPEDVCPLLYSSDSDYYGYFWGCLYFCMIKDGTLTTDSTYSYIWDGQGQFLRWMPFCMNTSYASESDSISSAQKNTSGYTYTYYIMLKNAQIAIAFKCSNWGTHLKCIIAGEIFKETGHTSDTNILGAIGLNDLSDFDWNFTLGDSVEYNSKILLNAYPGAVLFFNSIIKYIPTASQIVASDNTVYSNTFGNLTWKCRLGFDSTVTSNDVSSVITSPGGRWTPCYMFLQAADHDTYNVVPGDGFKGYIDTDLLRGVNPNYSYGQLLADGDFVYLGGGFAIGWDSDNDILLF